MRFAVVGLSHHTAPISIREQLAQHMQDLRGRLTGALRVDAVSEVCIISTCNRIELYAAGQCSPASLARAIRSYLMAASGLDPERLDPHLYQHLGSQAVLHLFRVASSLDSMVIGEPQILGQVKEAFRIAAEEKAVGRELHRCFERAFAVAKRVRTETGIGENAISMSFAAVEIGRQIFDSLEGKQVLLVGAGKMATLAAKHLMQYGVTEVRVASRSLETAQKLASEIGGFASSLTDLPLLLGSADIVICSTAAPTHVIDKKMMAKVVRDRRYRPILLVDIAVPRDVQPSVSELDNVFLYDVDDLETVLEDNRELRAKEAAAAEEIVKAEVAAFERRSKAQAVVPVIKALRARAMEVALGESERTLSHVASPDKKTIQSIRAMGQSIVSKLLHPVLSKLKEEGAAGDPQALSEALVTLFGLDPRSFEDRGDLDVVDDDRRSSNDDRRSSDDDRRSSDDDRRSSDDDGRSSEEPEGDLEDSNVLRFARKDSG